MHNTFARCCASTVDFCYLLPTFCVAVCLLLCLVPRGLHIFCSDEYIYSHEHCIFASHTSFALLEKKKTRRCPIYISRQNCALLSHPTIEHCAYFARTVCEHISLQVLSNRCTLALSQIARSHSKACTRCFCIGLHPIVPFCCAIFLFCCFPKAN